MSDIANLVVRNGTIIDGSGTEPFEADLSVADGKILAIGANLPRGEKEIDARGKIVTPASSTCTRITTHRLPGATASRRLRGMA